MKKKEKKKDKINKYCHHQPTNPRKKKATKQNKTKKQKMHEIETNIFFVSNKTKMVTGV